MQGLLQQQLCFQGKCYYINHFNLLFSFAVFLDAFEKLRKATISFVVSVCLSVRFSFRTERLGFH
jgi:hypothetical protein